ncbi:TPA: AraC family transcriptional regulator [Acinetobacter baumannii]|uniref:AraC family transcriptional regulator n=2 Tax=Acinetobacter baumannii TaxID=470 RepID=UPI000707C01C|nr:AraC family transcriptional regulator [Acinetobacter baumannii]KQK46135.1 AraC family transcriptional regulator [Acinetobacter baumannii]MBJ9774430.1 AraC family transcriptional regulator [Acinetobacter baumannii]MDC4413115.1 AraC family transcriptional regulator [Acinetobacter baumannii]MDK2199209.1 AraC family transcriptional regulator [Acinetobacter baumannii]MDV7231921.1 AraC family transcriptional regulator [Acinetobacter baumannii]
MNQANSHELNGRHFQNEPIFTDHNLVFDHHDLSETCRNVGQIFKPHDLKISHQKRDFSATMHHVKTGALSISRLEYGADVIIEPDHLDNFYLIQIPTQGYAEIEFGSQKFISYSQVASLISPQQSLRMRWHANSPQLILKVSKDDFTYHCRQHIADPENNLLVFDPKLDFSTQGGAYFLQLVRTLMDALACEQHPLHHPLAFKQFESNLFNALIYGQPNNALHKLDHYKEKTVSPYFVKRTEAYIKEHLHEPLNVEILAEHAGVSVRTLFTGFKNYLGTTPMSYLKELRFEQAHLELMHNENLSVTDVAFKWGFTHLGRFSQEYKRRYGELPSSTRRSGQSEGSGIITSIFS